MSVQKLQSLEMLRAVAALLVVMFHTQWIFGTHTGTSPFAGMFVGGYRGVDLFFVLSGFIIARVHTADIGRPRRLGNYVFNRIARVYPAVWIMTACAGGLYAAGFGGALKTGKLTAWGIAASALLLPQIGAPLVNVTWTLKYEVFFYLVFGVMIMDLRVGLAFLGAWQLAVLSASPWFPQGVPLPGGFYLRSICLEFSVGLACAWLLGRPRFVMALHCAVAQRAVLAVGIAIFVGGMWAQVDSIAAGIASALGAGAVIVGLILLEQSGRIHVPPALVQLGGASYAIYLVHFSIITLLATVLVRVPAVPRNDAVYLAVAAFAVTVGLAFHRLVDQPIQRLLQRKLKPMLVYQTAAGAVRVAARSRYQAPALAPEQPDHDREAISDSCNCS
jgi:exopolysaccharide production protein ExoZ